MRDHWKIWGVQGDGNLREVRIFGIWFYKRVVSQKWAPMMTEFERERGIRIGHRRFGMTETVQQFHDGKEPAVVRKAF